MFTTVVLANLHNINGRSSSPDDNSVEEEEEEKRKESLKLLLLMKKGREEGFIPLLSQQFTLITKYTVLKKRDDACTTAPHLVLHNPLPCDLSKTKLGGVR